MDVIEILGWAAAILTFLTYSQKAMLKLRIFGIGANLCFIIWSWDAGLYPTLALHVALLPMNLYRLAEILTIRRRAARVQAGRAQPLDWLRPYARAATHPDGTLIFRAGDRPDRLYYLVSGRVVFDEIGRTAEPGELFGELAFFGSERLRSSSARCEGRCEVLSLDARDLATLTLQDPAFNLYVMRTIADRLVPDGMAGPTPRGAV